MTIIGNSPSIRLVVRIRAVVQVKFANEINRIPVKISTKSGTVDAIIHKEVRYKKEEFIKTKVS